MRPFKITCLTYKTLTTLVEEAVSSISDEEIEIRLVEGLREELIEKLRVEEREGVEVIIAGGANAKIAQACSGLPVIEYKITAYDYLEAISKALTLGTSISIVTYRYPIPGALEQHLRNSNVLYRNIVYDNTEDLREKIRGSRANVVIGAAHAIEIAIEQGCQYVLIYSGAAAILETIGEAKRLASELRRNREIFGFSQAMVEHSPNGVILVDAEGVVMEANPMARTFFSSFGALVGKDASRIVGYEEFFRNGLAELKTVQNHEGIEMLADWVRLVAPRHTFIGALGIFIRMSEIARAQMDFQNRLIRERAERGFIAKSTFQDILGESEAIVELINDARFCATSDANILIYGETGVGKEILAQSIHNESRRKDDPFLAINCAALPEQLLESELFGYDEGAFTGGRKGGKKGLFEMAGHGTIFLDEIGELSTALQTRLLRVLQEKEIMRVGGDRMIPVDARVLSATNRNLETLPHETFRKDLYYRLNVLELHVPSLRQREGDAILLFRKFLHQKEPMRCYEAFPEYMCTILREYSWPGNIRELQNVCERYSLYTSRFSKSNERFLLSSLIRAIGEDRLFADLASKYIPSGEKPSPGAIEKLQELFGYSKEKLGERLGVSRTTLWRMTRDCS